MTEENTDPDTAYQEALDRTCSNWTVPANWDQSRCALDGSPCGTKDCPHISPNTVNNSPAPACCDDDEACGEDPEPKDSPTPEEIDAAWKHLRSLIDHADYHAVAIIAYDNGPGNQFSSAKSDKLLVPENINEPIPHLPWMGVLGALSLIHEIAKKNPDAILAGIGHFFDSHLKQNPNNDLRSLLLGFAAAKSPDEEQGEQESNEG